MYTLLSQNILMFEEFYEEAWDESAKVIYIRKVKAYEYSGGNILNIQNQIENDSSLSDYSIYKAQWIN